MIAPTDQLSIRTLFRRYWGKIALTWGLTFVETALTALLPLLIGWSIDGLLANDLSHFYQLLAILSVLLVVAVSRRAYDTRAYGTMRVELGKAQAARAGEAEGVGVTNARVLMGRELVDFLEETLPVTMTAAVQVIASVTILYTFHLTLSAAAGGAALGAMVLFILFAGRFYRLNADLNDTSEGQVAALESKKPARISTHFLTLRRHEVRLSDTESIVYGLIFFILLTMMMFNLWFAATQTKATPGQIFTIVTYSLELLEAAVLLPVALQDWTRLREIKGRINVGGNC